MSEPNDNNAAGATSRADDLLSAIRAALTADASDEDKAGAVSAARAILRGLEPQARNGAMASSAPSALAGTPLGAALGAISSIPREQLLEFLVSGLRSILSPGAPAYRARPPSPTSRASDGQP